MAYTHQDHPHRQFQRRHLPKETLARLNLQKGDTLYLTEGPQGIRLVPFDEEFAAQMEAAREVMRENRDVLQRLAE